MTPGTTYVSPAEKLNGGDSLSLFTYIFSKSGSTYTWFMEAQDLTTNADSYQNDTSKGLHFNFAISGALAVGNLSSCSEFPATKAVFTGTFVDHGFPKYTKLSPKWKGST